MAQVIQSNIGERVLGLPANFAVPDDIAVPMSVNAGVPVVIDDPKSSVSRSLEVIADSLLGSTGTNDFQVCMDGENRARDTIIKDWSKYTDSDRVGCIQPNVYLPTYIEWLTCMEMNKAVREARQASGTPIDNPNARVTLPRVNWLGAF